MLHMIESKFFTLVQGGRTLRLPVSAFFVPAPYEWIPEDKLLRGHSSARDTEQLPVS